MTDWEKIKTEYLSGNTSYRKLAAKYNISEHRIERRGGKENWRLLREQRLQTMPSVSVTPSLSEKNALSAGKIMEVADQILEKISETLATVATLDGNTLKHFTAALKELRDIKGIKSEADIREQEIRMENLRKSADKSSEPTIVEVVFHAGEEAWNE
ncbi:MAG: hypothetical protein IJA86_03570 [Clostridia bacterium]|nr:hypothetical protein [Clostridia bacterium]